MFPIHDTEPSRRPPVAVYALIGFNAAVFLFQGSLSETGMHAFLDWFGLIPERLSAAFANRSLDFAAGWPLLSSQFLHGDWLHLLGNMWMLWLFGDNVEDRMGSLRFVSFYLLCGLIAGATHVFSAPSSLVPTIGASGAVAGVMGAYLLLFPRSRVIVLVPILFYPVFFQLRAVVFLGLWFLLQYVSGFGSALLGDEQVGGVAYWAHVGGFLAGALLCWPFLEPAGARRPLYRDEWGPEQAWRVAPGRRRPW